MPHPERGCPAGTGAQRQAWQTTVSPGSATAGQREANPQQPGPSPPLGSNLFVFPKGFLSSPLGWGPGHSSLSVSSSVKLAVGVGRLMVRSGQERVTMAPPRQTPQRSINLANQLPGQLTQPLCPCPDTSLWERVLCPLLSLAVLQEWGGGG